MFVVQWWFQLLLFLLFVSTTAGTARVEKENLYQILGVRKRATAKEIKSAYRRKALETHPDKRAKDVPEEQAAADFQRVVHAYEVLSNKDDRNAYDRTGQTSTHQGNFQFHFHRPPRRQPQQRQGNNNKPRMDQFKVQEAQSRVLHVTSLKHLKAIMLKDDEVHVTTKEIELEGKTKVTILEKNETMTIYKTQKVKKVITTETIIEHETVERHLLIAFTTPGRIETILDNDLVFPYPFAALSKQGIWWEDMLQTVKVRYDDPTKLTRFFHIPHRSKLNTPIFVFVKRGQTLDDYTKLQTHRRDKFTNWVWDQLKVNVNFINRHSHPVEIWWVHEDQVQRQNTLEADHVAHLTCRLSHTFWVRDARVNQHLTQPQLAKLTKKDLLSENSTMATFNVVKDDPDDQAFTIDIKACFDLDTNCHAWHGCNSNDVADMTHTAIYCRKTCGKCTAADDHAAKLDKQRCKDHQGSCRAWARRGECETNKEYMKLKCPKTCKFCLTEDEKRRRKEEQTKRRKERNEKLKKMRRKKKEHYGSDVNEDDGDDDDDDSEDFFDFADRDSDDNAFDSDDDPIDTDSDEDNDGSRRTLDSDDFDEDEFAFMEHSDEDSDEEEMTGGWSRHDEL